MDKTELGKKFLMEVGKIHDDTNQKYGDNPYSFHLELVVNSICELLPTYYPTASERDINIMLFAGAYHDTIEDARLTYNDVLKIAKKDLNDEDALLATEIVYALTNEKGRNRKERANDKYYEGIRQTKFAPFIKMCDRFANLMFSYSQESSMYKKYMDDLPYFEEQIGLELPLP